MSVPVTKVEIAFSTAPDDPSPNYVNITQYVKLLDGITIDHGRQDWVSLAQENKCTLTLINTDARFTPGNITSPYYPNVLKDRRIRVTVKDNGVTYTRFVGYVNEWPVTWPDASASTSTVRVTASSRMAARLGHEAVMRSVVENEILFDGPSAYYPLGEPEGATNAGNVSTQIQPNVTIIAGATGNRNDITFGTGTGPGTDSLTAPQFIRGPGGSAGAFLAATSSTPYNTVANGTLLTECFFLSSTAQEMGIVGLDGGDTRPFDDTHWIGIDATGHLTAQLINGATIFWTLTSSTIVTDGNTHHAALREFQDNTGVTYDLYLDGASVASTFMAGNHTSEAYRIYGGGNGISASCFVGTLSHIAVTWSSGTISTSRINNHYLAGHTGFAGEGSGARMARLATYAGVPSAQTTFDTGLSTSLDRQDTNGQTPLTLMQAVAQSENGILFDKTDGQLVFHDRGHRYNKMSSFTINGFNLNASLAPTMDDLGLVNDANVTRSGGVAVRVVDTDSVTQYGTYREDVQLLSLDDDEAFDAASWLVYLYADPLIRIPQADMELAAALPGFKAGLLTLEISDRITLQGLPDQAPAVSIDFFVEGWSETITAGSYIVSLFLSNALASNVWQLDSSTYSVLGVSTRPGY